MYQRPLSSSSTNVIHHNQQTSISKFWYKEFATYIRIYKQNVGLDQIPQDADQKQFKAKQYALNQLTKAPEPI